ncbi:MAG: response regulator [Ghiorsea sp.]|nr:response regulator [Ghiorsea sp.]
MSEAIKVLVVEDEPAMRKVITSFFEDFFTLEKVKFEIKVYADAMEGLFELNNNGQHYQIIVLDVMLPKISGDEIFNSLLHTNPEVAQRVLFSTASPEIVFDRFNDIELQVLQKPFSFPLFCDKVRRILHN